MSRLTKFRALSGDEKKTLLAALCGLPIIKIRLHYFGLKQSLGKLQRIPLALEHPQIDQLTYPAQTSRLVNAAARFLFHREACLERSIMLCSLLRRRGISSEIKIGVATDNIGNGIRAHAWVEITGEAINEQALSNEKFTTFNSSLTADYRDFP